MCHCNEEAREREGERGEEEGRGVGHNRGKGKQTDRPVTFTVARDVYVIFRPTPSLCHRKEKHGMDNAAAGKPCPSPTPPPDPRPCPYPRPCPLSPPLSAIPVLVLYPRPCPLSPSLPPIPAHIRYHRRRPVPPPSLQILLINSKFHEGVSVWESLGISEGRLGNLPDTSTGPASASLNGNPQTSSEAAGAVVPAATVGGKEMGKGKGKCGGRPSKTGEEQFSAFFESALGLAMGHWPKVCMGGGEGKGKGGGARGGGDKKGREEEEKGGGKAAMEVGEEEDKEEDEEDEEKEGGEGGAGGDGDDEMAKSADGPGEAGGDNDAAAPEEERGEGAGQKEEGSEPPPTKVARKGKRNDKSRRSSGGKGNKGGRNDKNAKGSKRELRKKAPRRAGWEGLSMHERIAYVMFLVNVFHVSSAPPPLCLLWLPFVLDLDL